MRIPYRQAKALEAQLDKCDRVAEAYGAAKNVITAQRTVIAINANVIGSKDTLISIYRERDLVQVAKLDNAERKAKRTWWLVAGSFVSGLIISLLIN